MPEQETKSLIASYFPEKFELKFTVTYKPHTIDSIKDIISPALNGDYVYKVIGRVLKLYLDGTINADNINWGNIKRVIDKDGFFYSWEIEINGKKFHPDLLTNEISFNNSKRVAIINEDDIQDLIILLNTTKTVEQFLLEV